MIHSISANSLTFKTVKFTDHFSVVVAERTAGESEKQTRNGAGKSSLIEILHFCLGSNNSGSLSATPVNEWEYSVELDLGEHLIVATRSPAQSARIYLSGRGAHGIDVELRISDDGRQYVSVRDWIAVLSRYLYGLVPSDDADLAERPSARSLLSYAARRGRDAFTSPFTFFRTQRAASIQTNTAYLLGLNWEFPSRAETLKREEAALDTARKAVEAWRSAAAGSSVAGGLVPAYASEGSLEALCVNLERATRADEQRLRAFKVHPRYSELEEQAASLTREIHELVTRNVSDKEMIGFYRTSVADEVPPDLALLAKVYAEAGVYFSEQLVKRLEDVENFHERIVRNRAAYLASEIMRLEGVVQERESARAKLASQRVAVLAFLEAHGALEDFIALQDAAARNRDLLAAVRAQLDQLRQFGARKATLRIERDQLVLDARADLEERRPRLSHVLDIFGEVTAALYETPGTLAVDVSAAGGFTFDIDVERGRSQGVKEMMVFAYDLTLARIAAEGNSGPGFLIHDSSIFDGVDERQVANALELAHAWSGEHSFQYICCLNSDTIPWDELRDNFPLHESTAIELTDADASGGLFGLRFD